MNASIAMARRTPPPAPWLHRARRTGGDVHVRRSPSLTVVRPGTRPYTDTSTAASERSRSHPSRLLARTILIPSSSNSSPPADRMDDVLRHLPVAEHHPGGRLDMVLLFTPSLAHLAHPASSFVRDAIGRLLPASEAIEASRTARRCRVLAAVVDRLPGHRTSTCTTDLDVSSLAPGIGDDEREGISLLAVSSAAGSLSVIVRPMLAGTHPGGGAERSERPPSLSLRMPPEGKDHALINRRLDVRLANTLFHTGHESTMVASDWTSAVEARQWICHGQDRCIQVELDLTHHDESRMRWSADLRVPLTPLTPPRRIVESFGNILRRLEVDGDGQTSVPASQELELALDAYLIDHGLQAQPVNVWAFIVPRRRRPWTADVAWDGSDVARSIHAGARLHRVWSGGGGWGSKRGLLALDPASHDRTEADPEHACGNGGGKDQDVARLRLGQVAAPGDYVQFLLSGASRTDQGVDRSPSIPDRRPAKTSRRILSVIVGVAGSHELPISSDPPAVLVPPSAPAQVGLETIDDHFGALSTQGLDYRSRMGGGDGQEMTTTIDVPLTRLHMRLEA